MLKISLAVHLSLEFRNLNEYFSEIISRCLSRQPGSGSVRRLVLAVRKERTEFFTQQERIV
jgi:hypothetical protein